MAAELLLLRRPPSESQVSASDIIRSHSRLSPASSAERAWGPNVWISYAARLRPKACRERKSRSVSEIRSMLFIRSGRSKRERMFRRFDQVLRREGNSRVERHHPGLLEGRMPVTWSCRFPQTFAQRFNHNALFPLFPADGTWSSFSRACILMLLPVSVAEISL
jgi:hypothetical protein